MNLTKLYRVAIFCLCCGLLHGEEELVPLTPQPLEESVLSSPTELFPSNDGYDALQGVLNSRPSSAAPDIAKDAGKSVVQEQPIIDTPATLSQPFPRKHPEISRTSGAELAPIAQAGSVQSPVSDKETPNVVSVDLASAFAASPIIYSILFGMSVLALFTWFYTLATIKRETRVPSALYQDLKGKLANNHYEEALVLCQNRIPIMCKMLTSGILCRRHGLPVILETMKTEGKRGSAHFWQKINVLNDIAVIAPLLGLLGTVMGMFYAFYDVNRSTESVAMLFDGLGVSVGTTVAGLIVSILALLLHSTAKHRLMGALIKVENEAQLLASYMENPAELKG